jgi:hypothetical protein
VSRALPAAERHRDDAPGTGDYLERPRFSRHRTRPPTPDLDFDDDASPIDSALFLGATSEPPPEEDP